MIELPYGRGTIRGEITPDFVLRARSGAAPEGRFGAEIVEEAMDRPFGGRPLYELARGKRRATVILSDHTRPVPSRDIVPRILHQLRRGNPDIQVTLLVATGCHRGTSRRELTEKLGEELVERETICVHDAADADAHVMAGTLPSGAPLLVDRRAVETDLLVAEGLIEPHFFAGFSGGRKSVLPGVCARETVLANHCGQFIASPYSRTGVLAGNPIHRDMAAAAEMVHLAYIVNVVIDSGKRTVAAFAGEPESAHTAGTDFLMRRCIVSAKPADIVITSNGGAPLDQNLYQCVKGMTAGEAASREGGVIVLCAELADGVGGEAFYRSLKGCTSPAELYRQFCDTPQGDTIPDQWQSQILARVLAHRRVILVTEKKWESTVRDMKMLYAPNLEEAAALARGLVGTSGTVAVIPDGVSVIVDPAAC